MKKTFLLLSITGLLIFSCSKENDLVQSKTASMNEFDGNSIQMKDGVLKFESWATFNDLKLKLVSSCEKHCSDYFVPLDAQGLTDDELNQKAEEENFNQFQPIHDFSNHLNFSSLYQKLEAKEKLWLLNPENLNELDDELDPFNNIERYESALFNKDGNVYIANELINIKSLVYTTALKSTTGGGCKTWDNNPKVIEYNNGNKVRKMKGVVGPRPFQVISTTTMHTRKNNGSYIAWFTKPYATTSGNVVGVQSGGYCNNDATISLPYKQSFTLWGHYVYNYYWYGQSGYGAQIYTNIIQSQHAAPGKTMYHAY